MDTPIRLPNDFKEFLKLLRANEVEYMVVGGYAVGYYGYPRPTGDMDIWVSNSHQNAEKLVSALKKFGFASAELSVELFTQRKSIVRMGVPPFKLEIITYIDGVAFAECYPERTITNIDGINVELISLEHLKKNKLASGRPKDINDLENLA